MKFKGKRGFTLIESIMGFGITGILALGLIFVFRSHLFQWIRGDREGKKNIELTLLSKSLYLDVKRAGPPLEIDDQGNISLTGEKRGQIGTGRVIIVNCPQEMESNGLEIDIYSLKKPGSLQKIKYYIDSDNPKKGLIREGDGKKSIVSSNISRIYFSPSAEKAWILQVKGTLLYPEEYGGKLEEKDQNFTLEIRLESDRVRIE